MTELLVQIIESLLSPSLILRGGLAGSGVGNEFPKWLWIRPDVTDVINAIIACLTEA